MVLTSQLHNLYFWKALQTRAREVYKLLFYSSVTQKIRKIAKFRVLGTVKVKR
jgi:hypothetical protein